MGERFECGQNADSRCRSAEKRVPCQLRNFECRSFQSRFGRVRVGPGCDSRIDAARYA
jgi:hypothetical protein